MSIDQSGWMPKIGICVPHDIRDAVFAEAEKRGLTASQYIRHLLILELRPAK